MKKLLLLLFLLPNLGWADGEMPEYYYEVSEVAVCEKNVAALKLPEFISKRIAGECGLFEVFSGSLQAGFTTFDINQDNMIDYKVVLNGSSYSGSAGPLHLIYISNPKGYTLAFDDLSQAIDYDDDKKMFVLGTHGSYCNQSGHIL